MKSELVAADPTLWEKIFARLEKKDGALDTQCWEYRGARDKEGYGKVRVGKRISRANRVVYNLFFAEALPDQVVRHKCDNPPCCNPDHLEVGSHIDNMKDMVDRGRHKNSALLTSEQVVEVRKLKLRGYTASFLALKYNVSESTIFAVLSGQNWKDSLDFLEEGDTE